MSTTVVISTKAEYWGPDCDEATAQAAARRLGEKLQAYARERWPRVEVNVVLDSAENNVFGRDHAVVDDLADYSERVWDDALAEVIT